MKRTQNIQTQHFAKAVKKLTTAGLNALVKTLAKVKAIDKEGYLIDVEYVYTEGRETLLEGVPVLKNKYFNTPIYEGDLVMLLTLDETLDSYILQGVYTNTARVSNYYAVPYTLFLDFQHKNEFSIITKEQKFKLQLNEEAGLAVESKVANKQKHKEIAVESESTIGLKSQQDTKVEAATIELKTAGMTLGGAIEQLIDVFANVSVLNTPNGGPVAEWPSIVAGLKALKPMIKQNFK